MNWLERASNLLMRFRWMKMRIWGSCSCMAVFTWSCHFSRIRFGQVDGYWFYDLSYVDRFNIPISIKQFGTENGGNCRRQRCYFNMTTCPEKFKFNGNGRGQMIACYIVCTATKETIYFWPEDKVPKGKRRASVNSQVFKKQCSDVYTWAYDYDNSDRKCRGNLVSGCEVALCGKIIKSGFIRVYSLS